MLSQPADCRSCRYYLPRSSKVGILHTDGKVWEYKTEMRCEKHSAAVERGGPCTWYEREPGAD